MSSSSSKEVKAFLIAVRAATSPAPTAGPRARGRETLIGDSERPKAEGSLGEVLVSRRRDARALRTGTHAHFSVYSKALRLLAGIVTESLSWETCSLVGVHVGELERFSIPQTRRGPRPSGPRDCGGISRPSPPLERRDRRLALPDPVLGRAHSFAKATA